MIDKNSKNNIIFTLYKYIENNIHEIIYGSSE